MIDVNNLSHKTNLECNFQDLPPALIERVSLHLLKDEAPFFCVLIRDALNVEVYVLTLSRVIKIVARVEKGKFIFTHHDSGSKSFLFSDFTGLEHNESGVYESYVLDFIGRSGTLQFHFWDRNLFFRFASEIISTANRNEKYKERGELKKAG